VTSLDVGANLVVERRDVIISVISALISCNTIVWLLFRVLQWKPHYEVR
jgi:hypothetical protein